MTSITVLVMFKCNNRRLALTEGIKLEGLMEEFMKAFGDVLTTDVVPTELLFQKFDPSYQEWVDITRDEKICDGEKIRVLDLSDERGPVFPGVYPHRIKADATYRIWSLVSRSHASLMKRNGSTIKCNGGTSDNANLLDIQAKDVSSSLDMKQLYRLELKDPHDSSKIYLITGKGENKEVVVQNVSASSPPNTTETKFEPKYFYSFTQFRCLGVNGEDDLYLASDENGKTTLAKAGPLVEYPNPATLFICSQYT